MDDKIRAMESLRDDLCGLADSIASPSWHGNVLAGRETAIRSGRDRFEDWEIAKLEIEHDLP
jgi:hypothetical protein